MTYRHLFSVSWIGRFPMDMLRYDSCYPVSTDSIHNIEASLEEHAEGKRSSRRAQMASVRTDKRWTPTVGRWTSFGCGVRTERVEKL